MLPRQSSWRYFEGYRAYLDYYYLYNHDHQPYSKEHLVYEEALEYIFLIVDFPGIDHVEYLQDNENIEHIGHVPAVPIYVLFIDIKG